jgi:hypothetical protein
MNNGLRGETATPPDSALKEAAPIVLFYLGESAYNNRPKTIHGTASWLTL